MSYETTNYERVDPKAPGMYFLRDALGCDELGITVVDVDAGWEGMAHDHAGEGHEEVYLLLNGAATIDVEGDSVSLEAGDAIRVPPTASRQLRFEEDGQMVIVGAP